MEVVEPNWIALIAFTAAWVATCVAGFYVSGSLPLAMAPEQVRSGSGPTLVVFNAVILVALAAATLLYGLAELRWVSLVLAGGAVFFVRAPWQSRCCHHRSRIPSLAIG